MHDTERARYEQIINSLQDNNGDLTATLNKFSMSLENFISLYAQFNDLGGEVTPATVVEDLEKKLSKPLIVGFNVDTDNADSQINNFRQTIRDNPETLTINAKINTSETGTVGAKGNVALARGTLMGELGPELYVTGGRYYVAG